MTDQSAQSLIEAFQAQLPFSLDPFQLEAIEKLESHQGVLVSAPTSSGKTVIADYAIYRALQSGERAIYTTPLKALSNQKFRDYTDRYGPAAVGLVTGENTINPDGPVVVMTTEILRNLIYEDPERLDRVRFVIMDEIHYIDDFPRGAVWEEIIIQAPGEIKLIGLSATVSNFEELALWMTEQRGDIATVSVVKRPVELRLWLAMRNDLYPLLEENGTGIPRETLHRAHAESAADVRLSQFRRAPENDLLKIIDRLEGRELLPAIYFIFSRRGCREALDRCARRGLDLTSEEEKQAIDRMIKARLSRVQDNDEAALYLSMLERGSLRNGIAMHHAGLLPFIKEIVELLFQKALIKVVFATETLSLGIHMPARSVVVSSFTKFDGREFNQLTSGELTQLMGRAGRRGIDSVGHGVILKDPDVDLGTIYEAAVGEEMRVESKFAPTYNMILNLLRFHPMLEVDRLMERSFGQYQKQVARAELDERLNNLRSRLADLRAGQFAGLKHPCCSERTLAAFMRAEGDAVSARVQVRGLRRSNWRRGRRGKQSSAGVTISQAEEELRRAQARMHELPCRRCPHLRAHRAHHEQLRELEASIRQAEHDAGKSQDEYRRRTGRLAAVLGQLGFLEDGKPTHKGLLAARIYGENSLIITQAIEDGWLEQLSPEELAASLVMVSAEDRNRDRPRQRTHFPTAAIALAAKRLRILYYQFSAREKERGEETFRPLSGDYVNFTYDWCSATALTELQLEEGLEFGDAIKAIKGLYSVLRQMEWALTERPSLRRLIRRARERCERDLITRI